MVGGCGLLRIGGSGRWWSAGSRAGGGVVWGCGLEARADWRLVQVEAHVSGGAAAGAPRGSAGRAAGQRGGAREGRVLWSVVVGWFAGLASGARGADLRSQCFGESKKMILDGF